MRFQLAAEQAQNRTVSLVFDKWLKEIMARKTEGKEKTEGT